MTVTPVMDKMDAASLPPPMLDSKLASLLRICRDCPKEQVTPFTTLVSDVRPGRNLEKASPESCPFACQRYTTRKRHLKTDFQGFRVQA